MKSPEKNLVDPYDALSDKIDYWIAPEVKNKTAFKIILGMVALMMALAIVMSL